MYIQILKLVILNSILFFSWSSVEVSYVIAQENTDRLSITTKIEPNPYVSSVYKIPENTFFNFSSDSKICPTNNCTQRFENGLLFSLSADNIKLSGILKIEDKNTSKTNINNYRLLKTSGDFFILNTQNKEANQTTKFFKGSLEIGKESTKHIYDILGILTMPSGMFILETEPLLTNESGTNVSIVPGAFNEGNKAFSPNPINIKVGSTVRWTNDDTVFHTVTSGTGPADQHMGKVFDSGLSGPSALTTKGKTFSYTFTTAGAYPYFCELHPTMMGKVLVS